MHLYKLYKISLVLLEITLAIHQYEPVYSSQLRRSRSKLSDILLIVHSRTFGDRILNFNLLATNHVA